MSAKHKAKSTRDEFMARQNKMASVRDAARFADMAGRHYAKDKPSRIEVQMMIDAAVGSPWALFMAWCRHTLRTVTGARKAMEERFAAEQREQHAIADDVAEQLDPATNQGAVPLDESTEEMLERTGAVIDGDIGYEPKSRIIRATR